jgi:hypothetical protein
LQSPKPISRSLTLLRASFALPIATLGTAVALLAAGCGGGGTPSAQEQWANDVCTQVAAWQDQITRLGSDAKDDISSPQPGLIESLKAEGQEAVTATKQLGTNLQSLPLAPVDNGQTVKELLSTFASEVNQTVDALKKDLDTLTASSSAGDAIKTLTNAAASVSGVVAEGKSTLESIQETAGDLKQGFGDADACKDVRSDSS